MAQGEGPEFKPKRKETKLESWRIVYSVYSFLLKNIATNGLTPFVYEVSAKGHI
jgi:hypothetical protein